MYSKRLTQSPLSKSHDHHEVLGTINKSTNEWTAPLNYSAFQAWDFLI